MKINIGHKTSSHLKNAEYAHSYAANILRGRFLIGEEVIATSSCYSFYYARYVLGTRFPAGEEMILNDPCYRNLYRQLGF